jgi:glycosyltransferase involved in cell wall biosynthesis
MIGTNDLVSIVIPAFNAESTVVAAIDSALAQTYPNIEVVVVNDGSTDRTGEILKGFGPKITVIEQENLERSAARNTGIKAARGEFLSFLDADDTITPTKTEQQMQIVRSYTTAAVFYGRVEERDTNGVPLRLLGSGTVGATDIFERLIFSNVVPIQSVLLRRGVIERVGGFQLGLTHLEDWELWLRIACTELFVFQPEVLAYYRASDPREMREKCRRFNLQENVSKVVRASLKRRAIAHGASEAQSLLESKALANAYFKESRYAAASGDWKTTAVKYRKSAVEHLPTFLKGHVECLSLMTRHVGRSVFQDLSG